MLQDLHSHTFYSYCGKDDPEEVIRNAIINGLDVVGISDHYHGIVHNHPEITYHSDGAKLRLHREAMQRYYHHIKSLADKYKNEIDVRCGVEITTLDGGFHLLPDGVDVSYFDYVLIENFQHPDTSVDNVLDFAKRCNCPVTGFAHNDLPAYCEMKGFDMKEFFTSMAENNIFWEMNVNRDSKHNYYEHPYVKSFFGNEKLIQLVKETGVKLSVGFDGHILEEYDVDRVKDACKRIEELGLPLIR